MPEQSLQRVEEDHDVEAAQGSLSRVLPWLAGLPSCRRLLDALDQRPGRMVQVAPLLEAPRPALVALLHAHLARPLLLLTAGPELARRLYEALRLYSSIPEAVLLFPATDARPYERMAPDSNIVAQRLGVLEALARWRAGGGMPPLVVAAARAAVQPTLSPAEFAQTSQTIQQGMVLPIGEWARRWAEWGYQLAKVVEEPGEFARRGGIVDIYPPTASLPLRIELFGDQVESIRQFDPATQRSRRQVATFTLTTPFEMPWWQRQRAVEYLRRVEGETLRPEVAGELTRDREYLEQGILFEGVHLYAPLLHEAAGCLLDHFPADTLAVLDEPEQFQAAVQEFEAQASAVRFELVQSGELPANFPHPLLTWDEVAARLAARRQAGLSINTPAEEGAALALPFAPLPHYGGQLKEVLNAVAGRLAQGERVVIVSFQAARLVSLLHEQGLSPRAEHLEVIPGRLPSGGWACPEAGLTLFTDSEVFGYAPPRRRPLVRRPRRELLREELLQRLAVGDYVVHEDHGIAIYEGLTRLALADGVEREYLFLRYAAADRLYVPVDQVDRVRRYIGAGDGPPALHRLGTGDWERAKSRVHKAVQIMARELLDLYAAREVARGTAFSPDTPWQSDLESSFPYIETEGQLRAVTEVKLDMEQPRPMDRLVCGDVGYGKTEVALRAAFKAVMDGKQAAVLVPTTVLAQQHYRTFHERLGPFPVNVEMLSRFRRPAEQRKVLEGLARGEVDIVIGTHRLLSKDVTFKDLGLVVVDEEQRFGVRHKEHLKQLRREVDVLTLTATPIPRTLHMSLTGLRDMSVIETPPEERVPIRTYVIPHNDKVVRGAILRELERGGQVYFVHNRVQTIYRKARELQQLVPEARIAVGHGQMPEHELERVMLGFVAGQYDVLVCTTIIESGLDIPNVNTIIIDNAIFLGLAQLYQLRGRVGRGAVRAYAYLLYHPGREMGEPAQKRLQAILEATDLGAGFQIAMRDLEIRGAGNLLGAEQSGHIAAVGFDLYARLLAHAVEELQTAGGESEHLTRVREEGQRARAELRGPAPITLDLPLRAYLPPEYVAEAEVRLQLYRNMAEVRTARQVQEIARELRDRFGEPPELAQALLELLRLRVLALRARAREVRSDGRILYISTAEGVRPALGDLPRWLQQRLRVRAGFVELNLEGLGERWLEVLRRVLLALAHGEEE
jgi:transcription-repair coupling factor (superfamily II helicase)